MLETLLVALCLTMPQGIEERTVPPQGGKPTHRQSTDGQSPGRESPGRQRTDRQRTDRQRTDARAEREVRRQESHLASAFPRTQALLTYLAHSDRQVHKAVLRHSARLTTQREKAALQMAREHHPQLFQLIQRSKKRFPRSYQSAVRELVVDYVKIRRAAAVGRAEYQSALQEWQLRSQVRLLAARLTVENAPELQRQLVVLLKKADQAKRRQLELAIRRQQQQIKRLQKRLAQDPQKDIDRQLRVIQRRLKNRKNRNRNPKPSPKKKPDNPRRRNG